MNATETTNRSFRRAWIFLCLALAVHVADEALTGFLNIYNPTVAALRSQTSWLPLPTFAFREWLTGLILVCAVLLLLAVWADQRHRIMKVLAYIFAVIMLANAAAHTAGTIMGHTVSGLTFPRPMPGFYSSPLLLIAAVYLLVSLKRKASVW